MLYLLSALSVMYILLMYYIFLLLLPPDGFVLCYIGLLVLTLWRFDDDVISPSPGKGRYTYTLSMVFHLVRCHLASDKHPNICSNSATQIFARSWRPNDSSSQPKKFQRYSQKFIQGQNSCMNLRTYKDITAKTQATRGSSIGIMPRNS